MGQFALDLTEQKQSLKTLQLSNEYLQEINTRTRDKLNQIAEKLESQSNINEAVAEDIIDAAQRKMNEYHSQKAQEFKRIREQNEIKKWKQN